MNRARTIAAPSQMKRGLNSQTFGNDFMLHKIADRHNNFDVFAVRHSEGEQIVKAIDKLRLIVRISARLFQIVSKNNGVETVGLCVRGGERKHN